MPEDFGDGWTVIAAENFYLADSLSRPLEKPFGALWAIKTHKIENNNKTCFSSGDHAHIVSLTASELIIEANTLIAAGKAEKAVSFYRIWLDSTQSTVAYALYFNLGVALSNFGDYQNAEQSYLKALSLNPGFEQAQINLSNLRSLMT